MANAPKKVVRVQPTKSTTSGTTSSTGKKEAVWTPTPESKKQAGTLRVFAWIAWLLAIALEVFTIFFILPKDPVNIVWLIVALVIIAVLAVIGNLLWKKANRLDPASKANSTKFFIQNQLGAFMTVLAFLPLVILIFTNKNMDGKDKAITGGIGAVLLIAVAVFTGVEWDGGPSQEQYAAEENIIVLLTGEDTVYWTKSGKVFHVCEAVPDVNKESKDGNIYEGTVADAHAAGKERITQRWPSEAVNYCGYTQEEVDAVKAKLAGEDLPELDDDSVGFTDVDELDGDDGGSGSGSGDSTDGTDDSDSDDGDSGDKDDAGKTDKDE